MALRRLIWRSAIGLIVFVLLLMAGVWVIARHRRADIGEGQTHQSIVIGSSSFGNDEKIPTRFTCKGGNVSPEVHWGTLPDATKSLALVMEDTDAPFGFVHWLVYNIPGEASDLQESASSQGHLPLGAVEGVNSLNTAGYFGPCPPSGTHHYVFRVYALDADLALAPGRTKKELAAGVRGHVLAEGQMTGLYGRE